MSEKCILQSHPEFVLWACFLSNLYTNTKENSTECSVHKIRGKNRSKLDNKKKRLTWTASFWADQQQEKSLHQDSSLINSYISKPTKAIKSNKQSKTQAQDSSLNVKPTGKQQKKWDCHKELLSMSSNQKKPYPSWEAH